MAWVAHRTSAHPPQRTLGARGKPPLPWGDASLTHPSQRSILGERLRLQDPKEGRERGHLEEVVGGCRRLPSKMRRDGKRTLQPWEDPALGRAQAFCSISWGWRGRGGGARESPTSWPSGASRIWGLRPPSPFRQAAAAGAAGDETYSTPVVRARPRFLGFGRVFFRVPVPILIAVSGSGQRGRCRPESRTRLSD